MVFIYLYCLVVLNKCHKPLICLNHTSVRSKGIHTGTKHQHIPPHCGNIFRVPMNLIVVFVLMGSLKIDEVLTLSSRILFVALVLYKVTW